MKQYRIDVLKEVVYSAVAILIFVFAAMAFAAKSTFFFALLSCLGLFYLGIGIYYGGKVTMDSAGVHLHRFLGYERSILWEDVQEVGIVGTKVIKRKENGKCGVRYLYFSPRVLQDTDRFQMCLEWPRDTIGICYSKDLVIQVQQFWTKPICLYNEGDLEL
ncbi:MAG: hypothetical protein LUG61_04400 [Lachnospiraceae bacterium]|nr:hypothetical protein [Lachnospiraceae bacterium]